MEKCHFVNIFCNFLADFQNIEKGCFVNRFRVAESDGGANFPHCALQLLRAAALLSSHYMFSSKSFWQLFGKASTEKEWKFMQFFIVVAAFDRVFSSAVHVGPE